MTRFIAREALDEETSATNLVNAARDYRDEVKKHARLYDEEHADGGKNGTVGMLARRFWFLHEAFIKCNEQHTLLRAMTYNAGGNHALAPYLEEAREAVIEAHGIKLRVEADWHHLAKNSTVRSGLVKDWPGSSDYR